LNSKIFFESLDGKIYEVFCEQVESCTPDKCVVFCKFDDGMMFDMDRQRKEMFDYIREKYKDIKK